MRLNVGMMHCSWFQLCARVEARLSNRVPCTYIFSEIQQWGYCQIGFKNMKSRLSSLCSFVTGFLSQVYLHWVADELKIRTWSFGMGLNGFIAALTSELFMCCVLPDSKGLQSRFKEICAYRLIWFFSVSCNTSDNIHSDHTEALVLIPFTFCKPLVTLLSHGPCQQVCWSSTA